MASISRGSGTLVISWASESSRLVSPLIALTIRTTSCPSSCVRSARLATARMRSSEPTDVPPNFWTMSATAPSFYVRRRLGVKRSGSAITGNERLGQETPAVYRDEEENLEREADLGWAQHLHSEREQHVGDDELD